MAIKYLDDYTKHCEVHNDEQPTYLIKTNNRLISFAEDYLKHGLPDSIPSSDRRWLLVGWSADFANFGPMLAIGCIVSRFYQCWPNGGLPTPQLRLDISIFCRCWANVEPTVDYSRWR